MVMLMILFVLEEVFELLSIFACVLRWTLRAESMKKK